MERQKESGRKKQKNDSHFKRGSEYGQSRQSNPALLDKVMGLLRFPDAAENLANISVPDPRTLLIAPFDPKSIAEIEKAINVANIGINPSNDGKAVRLVIPQVSRGTQKES